MTVKINEAIKKIQNARIKRITTEAFNNVAPRFFHEAASTSGKYHPIFSLGDGGLVRHVLAAAHFCERFLVAAPQLSQYEKDIALAAVLLHDSCKCGVEFESSYTVFEHPILVCQLFTPHTVEDRDTWKDICSLIASHMGCWNKPTKRDITNRLRLDEIIAAFKKSGYFVRPDIKSLSVEEIQNELALPTPDTFLRQLVANSDYVAADRSLTGLADVFDEESEEEYSDDIATACTVEDPYALNYKSKEDEPATKKQISYLSYLLSETCQKDRFAWVDLDTITKLKAAAAISELVKEVG